MRFGTSGRLKAKLNRAYKEICSIKVHEPEHRHNIICRGWICYPSGAVAATTVHAADAEGRHTKILDVMRGSTPAAEAGSRTSLSSWTRGGIFVGLLLLTVQDMVSTVQDRGAAGEVPD